MRTLLVMALLAVTACGSSSGVDSNKQIFDLTDGEIDDLCDYILEKQGGARTEVCDDGEIEYPDHEECVDYLLSYGEDCTATVSDEEECAEQLGDDPCSDPAACHAADDC